MKSAKRLLGIILALASVQALLASCREDSAPEPVDWSLYSIVTPVDGPDLDDGMSGPGVYQKKSKMTEFIEKISELTGKDPEIRYETDTPVEYEIILGDCDRQDYREILKDVRYKDYVIMRSGNKFYVVAKTQERRTSAVTAFMKLMPELTADTPDGIIAESRGTYKGTGMTLNGTDISEFVIVYENVLAYSSELKELSGYYESGSREVLPAVSSRDAAVNIFDYRIVNLCGYRLKIISKGIYARNPEQYPHVIMFGDCGGISSELSPSSDNGYEVISDGNSVAVASCSVVVPLTGILGTTFVSQYFDSAPVTDGVITVTIPEGKTSGTLAIPG